MQSTDLNLLDSVEIHDFTYCTLFAIFIYGPSSS